MAKIITNPNSPRRLIRLSGEDVMMVIQRVQREFRSKAPNGDELDESFLQFPLYIPEDLA